MGSEIASGGRAVLSCGVGNLTAGSSPDTPRHRHKEAHDVRTRPRHSIRTVATLGVLSTMALGLPLLAASPASAAPGDTNIFAGTGKLPPPFLVAGKATKVPLNNPHGLAFDRNPKPKKGIGDPFGQNVFIADTNNCAIRNVDTTHHIHTIVNAAGPAACAPAVPGPAAASPLDFPHGVAVDPNNELLYIAEAGAAEVDAVNLAVGPNLAICQPSPIFAHPVGVAVDGKTGNLYVADNVTHIVAMYPFPCTANPPVIVAGVFNNPGWNGDGGLCTQTLLNAPSGIVYHAGALFISDTNNNEIRVCAGGVMNHVLGLPPVGGFTPDGPAPGGNVLITQPHTLKFDGGGHLIFDEDGPASLRVRSFDGANLSTVVGGGPLLPPLPPGVIPAPQTIIGAAGPHGLAIIPDPSCPPTSAFQADVLYSDTSFNALNPPGGTSSVIRVQCAAVPEPTPPVVTKVHKNKGPVGGGNTVTISGSNFTGATEVDFGPTSAPDFQVSNDTTITVTVPPLANPMCPPGQVPPCIDVVPVSVSNAVGSPLFCPAYGYQIPVGGARTRGSGPGGHGA